jgi:hypothetical protein
MEFSRLLKKHDMSLSAYNGANKRRFVLFEKENDGITRRLEFDTARERKSYVLATLRRRALLAAPRVVTKSPLDRVLTGYVLCDIGQIDAHDKRILESAVRHGHIAKWRGRWYPHPGASYGIGPLKTCYGLASVRAQLP